MSHIKVSPSALLVLAAFVLLSSPIILVELISAAICHELGHYFVLHLIGGSVKFINITAMGVEMGVSGRIGYRGELLLTLSGPIVNIFFAVVFAAFGCYVTAGAQAVLGIFNLLPVRPLDGSKALWLIIAWLTEPFTADKVCVVVSATIAVILAVLSGVLLFQTGDGFFLLLSSIGLVYEIMSKAV